MLKPTNKIRSNCCARNGSSLSVMSPINYKDKTYKQEKTLRKRQKAYHPYKVMHSTLLYLHKVWILLLKWQMIRANDN